MSRMRPDPAPETLQITLPPGWARWLTHTQQVLARVDPANHSALQVAHLQVAEALEADQHPQANPRAHMYWRSALPDWLAEALAAAALHHHHEARAAGRRVADVAGHADPPSTRR